MGDLARDIGRAEDDADAFDRRFAKGFGDGRVERIQLAHLDAGGRLLAIHVGDPGSATAARLPIRRIVADALALDAAGWLLAHNHPSGDVAPSRADLQLTRRLQSLGAMLGIRLHDHLIFAGARRLSFRAEGLL